MLNQFCILGMSLTWSWCMIFFICFSIWFAIILLRICISTFIRDIGLYFIVAVLVCFWYQGTTIAPIEWVGKCSFFYVEKFVRIGGVFFFFNVWYNQILSYIFSSFCLFRNLSISPKLTNLLVFFLLFL